MEEIKKSMIEVLENDIKENGTWAMQFMTAFYPDKKLQYLKSEDAFHSWDQISNELEKSIEDLF